MNTRESVIKEFLDSERRTLKIRGGRGSLKTSVGVRAAYKYATERTECVLIVCEDSHEDLRYFGCFFKEFYGDQVHTELVYSKYLRVNFKEVGSGVVFVITVDQLAEFVRVFWYSIPFGLVIFDECFYSLHRKDLKTRHYTELVVRQAPRRIFIYSLTELAREESSPLIADVDLRYEIDIAMDYRDVPEDFLGKLFFHDADMLRKINKRLYERVYLDLL